MKRYCHVLLMGCGAVLGGRRAETVVVAPQRCSIPLRAVPADPKIDPEFILKPGGSQTPRMPLIKGLPPCPAH